MAPDIYQRREKFLVPLTKKIAKPHSVIAKLIGLILIYNNIQYNMYNLRLILIYTVIIYNTICTIYIIDLSGVELFQ
jgi:hypothetical protein